MVVVDDLRSRGVPHWREARRLREALLHPAEADWVFPTESPIERVLRRNLLEVAPGLDVTGYYALVRDHLEVTQFLRRAATETDAPDFIIFPQVKIDVFRVDFVAAARRPWEQEREYTVFILEADGAEFHAERVPKDSEREKIIRRITNWPILRFSGAEINFAQSAVGDVIEGFVEATCVDSGAESGSPRCRARERLRALVARMSRLPALRNELVNSATHDDRERLRRLLDELRYGHGYAD